MKMIQVRKNDTSEDSHSENTYVNADIRLDPDGELLPTDRYTELHAAATRQSKRLAEWQESRHIEAKILNASDGQSPPSKDTSSIDDITAIAAGNDGKSLQTHIEETMDLRAVVKNAYCKDTICAKIIAQPDAYPRFGIQEGLIWTKNQLKRDVICIPQDADHITFELTFCPNQPFLDAKPWIGIWLHDYFHTYHIFTICILNNGS